MLQRPRLLNHTVLVDLNGQVVERRTRCPWQDRVIFVEAAAELSPVGRVFVKGKEQA